jgi:hypothetical protein
MILDFTPPKSTLLSYDRARSNNKKNKQNENSNDEDWMENWTWKNRNDGEFPKRVAKTELQQQFWALTVALEEEILSHDVAS